MDSAKEILLKMNYRGGKYNNLVNEYSWFSDVIVRSEERTAKQSPELFALTYGIASSLRSSQ